MKQVFGSLVSILFFSILLYFGLKMLEIQIGTLIDWSVGVASLMWLIVVLTVPWDAYFRAKEVLDDAKISKRKDILVIEESLAYVRKVAKRSLVVAICLHFFTAILLYWVAASGISAVGYFSALAAVLLTFLRPAVRYYEYLQQHLATIRQEFRYPREDLSELLGKVDAMGYQIADLQNMLSDEKEVHSWKKEVDKKQIELAEKLEKLAEELKTLSEKNKLEHKDILAKISEVAQQIRQETQVKVDKITADSQILDSVRTLANFVKQIR